MHHDSITPLPPYFIERHRTTALAAALLLLVLIGLLLGKGVGSLGVYLIDAVVAQANPAR